MPFFDRFKKKSTNEKNIKDHGKGLISRYNEYVRAGSTVRLNPDNLFRNFHDNELFLRHLGTGYESTYLLLKNYMVLNQEINSQTMSEPVWKEKTKQANDINIEFQHEFEKLLLKIERGVEEFGGICEECRKWYSADDPYSKELILKLQAFKMPF
jgi:hypothetical protein